MLGAGLVYRNKEKSHLESVKIYTLVSVIGGILIVIAILMKFVF